MFELQLTMPADSITVIGLGLDILGIPLLFWFAPVEFPDPQSTAFFAVEGDSRDRWRKINCEESGWQEVVFCP